MDSGFSKLPKLVRKVLTVLQKFLLTTMPFFVILLKYFSMDLLLSETDLFLCSLYKTLFCLEGFFAVFVSQLAPLTIFF